MKSLIKILRDFSIALIANFLSIILFFAILPILFIAIIISSLSSISTGVKVTHYDAVRDLSVVSIVIDENIVEMPESNVFDVSLFNKKKPQTTYSLCEKIQSLSNLDSNKAIILNFGNYVSPSLNQLVEIRETLANYKKQDKQIYAYLSNTSQANYYLASVADKIYIDKLANIDFKGLALQGVFFGDALKKYGVDVEVIKVGKQKSFGEMFTSNKMSPLVKENYKGVLNSLWDSLLFDISNSRGVDVESLKDISNKYAMLSAQDALSLKLVDNIAYKDEFNAEMKELLGKKSTPISDYDLPLNSSKNKVAIVYMNGSIVNSDAQFNAIGSVYFSKLFGKLRKNKNIKSVVLRINSGGGDAYASEVIRRSVELLAKQKPVVASISSTCASGAYWISTACNKIVMQDESITGSIGVFSIYPSVSKLASDYGVSFDTVKTSDMADLGSIANSPTDKEVAVIQKSVDKIYSEFVNLVSKSRKIELQKVEEFADGRIFTGKQALELKLCDEKGSLNSAVELSSQLSDTRYYKTVDYPTLEPTEQIFRFVKSVEKFSFVKQYFQCLSIKDEYESMIKSKGIYARLPFDFQIK